MHRSRTWRRLPAVALMAVLAAGCVSSRPFPTAATDDLRAPLPTAPVAVEVLGATGDAIWADFHASGPSGITGNQLSLDGGRTWGPGVASSSYGFVAAASGRFAFYGGTGGPSLPTTFAPDEPQTLQTLQWEDDGRTPAAMGTAAVLWTNGLLGTRGATIRTRWPRLRAGSSQYVFSADSVWLVRIVRGGRTDQLSVAPVATGLGGPPLNLPAAVGYAADQAGLHALVRDADGLSVCAVTLPDGARYCVPVGVRAHTASLHQAGPISVVKADGKGFLVEAGWVTPITLPAGTRDWDAEGAGDPTRPLVRVLDSTGEPHHFRVEADGSLVPSFGVPRAHIMPDLLALTPTAVFATDRAARTSWRAQLVGRSLGSLARVDGVVVAASAGRLLVDSGAGVQAVDAERPGPVLAAGTAALSGPYVLTAGSVVTVAGTHLRADHPQAIFGSLVVERPPPGRPGYWVRVRDLAGTATPVDVQLSATTQELAPARLWGDWVGATFAAPGVGSGKVAELRDWRTGGSRSIDGELAAVGDGSALVVRGGSVSTVTLVAVDLAGGHETVLSSGRSFAALAVDRSRAAYVDGTDLVVAVLPGAHAGAARLLGALPTGEATATSPWSPALDFTGPVTAGTLVIRAADGTVVRSLPAQASGSGSVRGLAWDGRTETGTRVARGEYSWEYHAEAADGSGTARDVTGQAGPGGTIHVR